MQMRDGQKRLKAGGSVAFQIILFLCALCLSAEAHNCRFWGVVAEHAPGSAIYDQLVAHPNSLEKLSSYNVNGWGIGYYSDSAAEPMIERSRTAAYLDPFFDSIVTRVAAETPRIAVAHIRNCTSGLCDIPNPHPFEREKGGRHWLMGHNGTIDKSVLLDLIRPDYLAANPPQYGVNEDEWIDTDLYFIFMLQTIEDHDFEMKPALGDVVQSLRANIPGIFKQLNFFLTDGTALWSYCEGNTLYYLYNNGDTSYSAVASQYPGALPENWVAMDDGQLVTLTASSAPVLENIEDYFSPSGIDEDAGERASMPGSVALGQNVPNPFNASTVIEYSVSSRSPVEIAVYDILGRKVSTLVDEVKAPGNYVTYWNGNSSEGKPSATGIYFYIIRGQDFFETRKMLLLK